SRHGFLCRFASRHGNDVAGAQAVDEVGPRLQHPATFLELVRVVVGRSRLASLNVRKLELDRVIVEALAVQDRGRGGAGAVGVKCGQPISWKNLFSVVPAIGRSRLPRFGKMYLEPAASGLRYSKQSSAWLESGTMCGLSAFMRSAEIVHSARSRSSSSQGAATSSTLRVKVGPRASLACGPDAFSIASSNAGLCIAGRGFPPGS